MREAGKRFVWAVLYQGEEDSFILLSVPVAQSSIPVSLGFPLITAKEA